MERRRKAHVVQHPRSAPRDVAPSDESGRGYPGLGEIAGDTPVLAHARRLARLLFAAGAAAGLAAGAAGCEPPQCQTTRIAEVRVHGGDAITDLEDLRLEDAKQQLGVGLGITPHPVSAPLPGAMMPVYIPPVQAADAGTSDPDAGTEPGTEPTR